MGREPEAMWLKSVVPAVVTLAAVLPSLGAVAPPLPSSSLGPAEVLFRAGRVAEARSLLRRVVATDPAAEAAAEAEYRLGQSYEDAGDPARAITAYLACRRLRGGDAADAARRRLESLVEARDGAAHERDRPESRAIRAATTALKALARPGLTPAARAATERQVTVALIRACAASLGDSRAGAALLPAAIAAVHDSDLNEILRYLRVLAPADLPQPLKLASRRLELLAFGQTARSPALRAAALWQAAQAGARTESPDVVFASLPPTPAPAALAADPAVVFLTQAVGRDRLDFERDPRSLVPQAASTVRYQLIKGAYDAGRLEDMVRYDAALPVPPNAGVSEDPEMAMYRRYPDFDRAPLRLFAQASARTTPMENAMPLFLAVARQYPASALAAPSLLEAVVLLRRAHQDAQADAVRAEVLRDYPNSSPGLLFRAEDAAERDDLDGAEALLLRADPPPPAPQTDTTGTPLYPPPDVSAEAYWLRDRLRRLRQIRAALRPIAAAAGRPALADVPLADIPQSSEPDFLIGLADRLADAMPSQSVAVYRALMPKPPFLNLLLSLHALARDPLGTQTALIWDSLVTDSALDMGTFPLIASADEIAVAAGLLERTAGTPRAFQGLTLFERVVGGEGGVPTGRWRPALAALALADTGRGTRTSVAARNAAARRLLENWRPEDATALLDGASGPLLTADDPVRAEQSLLRRRAAEEIAAKRGPDWAPLWVSQVGPPGKVVIADAPDTVPTLVGGTVIVLWPGNAPEDYDAPNEGWAGLAGLDPSTGRRRWVAPLGSAVYDASGAAGRVFAVTQAGSMLALDAATGRVLYRRKFADDAGDPYPHAISPVTGWVVATDDALVCVPEESSGLVLGLDPVTGETRWRQHWRLAGIRGDPDKPPVIGNVLYCMTTDGHLRAVDPATGAVLWDHVTETEDPYSGHIGGGQPVPAGPGGLLRRGDALQVLSTQTGLPLPAARAAPGRIWMDGLLADGRYVVKWDQNRTGDVSRLPDLTALRVSIAAKSVEDHALLQGGILYAAVRDAGTNATVFQAVDVATGAVLGWWPLESSFESWVGADGKCVYLASADGSVRAFPRLGAAPRTGLTTRPARPGRRRASSLHL